MAISDDDLIDIKNRTADLLGLADVHRWTVIKTTRNQCVAEHSFSVAVIALSIAQQLGVDDPAILYQILFWALVHDAPESLTGDIDGKFKREFPEVSQVVRAAESEALPWYAAVTSNLNERVKVIVKVADHIENATFIQTWGLGPRADDVYQEIIHMIREEDTVALSRVMPHLSFDQVALIVRSIAHQQVMEFNSYQLRNPHK